MKHIKITEDQQVLLREQLEQALKTGKALTSITLTPPALTLNTEKAKVIFTASAFVKYRTLTTKTNVEIAWHGVTQKVKKGVYVVTDILTYPQEVSAAAADSIDGKYETWLYALPDEVFNNLKLQGHSHVKMAVSPSSTDITHRHNIVETLKDDEYFIFHITNHTGTNNFTIYDLEDNIFYENEDIETDVLLKTEGTTTTASDYYEEQYKNVTLKVHSYYNSTYKQDKVYDYSSRTYKVPPVQVSTPATKKTTTKKTTSKKK